MKLYDLPSDLITLIASYVGDDLRLPFRIDFYRQYLNYMPRHILSINYSLPNTFREEFHIAPCQDTGWHSDVCDKRRAEVMVYYGMDWKSYPTQFDVKTAYLPFFCDFVPENVVRYIIANAETDRIPWRSICSNRHLPVSFYRDHFDYIQWDYLSKNRGDLVELYDQYPDRLDWEFISQNPSVPLWFYKKYITRLNWYGIARNPKLPSRIMAGEVCDYLLAL